MLKIKSGLIGFMAAIIVCSDCATAQWRMTGLVGDVDVSALVFQNGRLSAGLFGWGGIAGGVHNSTNEGISWLEENDSLTNLNVLSLAVDGDEMLAGTLGGGVFVRVGDHWLSRNSGLTHLNVNSVLIRDGVFFAGTGGGGVSVSTNQGLQWTPSNNGLTNLWILSLYTNADDLWAGTGAGFSDVSGLRARGMSIDSGFLSSDGGQTWISRGLAGINVGGFATYGSFLFAGGLLGGGFHRTSDDGISWERSEIGQYSSVQCLAVADSLVIAGTSDGVFVSSDQGMTWHDFNSIPPGPFDVRSLALSDSNVFAGTWNSAVWKRSLSEILVAVHEPNLQTPSRSSISQNYPNPFNNISNFEFRIANLEDVTLKVYDLLGREVATVVNERLAPGTYTRQWTAKGVASGVFVYRLVAGEFVQTGKLVLLR